MRIVSVLPSLANWRHSAMHPGTSAETQVPVLDVTVCRPPAPVAASRGH